jgi:hypothetical protein
VSQLDSDGYEISFSRSKCSATRIRNGISSIITGYRRNDLYECELEVAKETPKVIRRRKRTSDYIPVPGLGQCYMMTIRSPPVSNRGRILTDPISTVNELVVDSGCSEHMFNSCRLLTDYVRYHPNEKTVSVANGSAVPVLGYGSYGILRRVYYVPLLSHSLLSVSSLAKYGIVTSFNDD